VEAAYPLLLSFLSSARRLSSRVLAPDSRDETEDLAGYRGIDAEDPSDQSGSVEGAVVTHVRSVKSKADQRGQKRSDHDTHGQPEERARQESGPTRSGGPSVKARLAGDSIVVDWAIRRRRTQPVGRGLVGSLWCVWDGHSTATA
jgi:hypothetical protein